MHDTGAGWSVAGALGFLHANPFLLLFLTLALGTRLGRLKAGFFELGSTAATLLAGIVLSLWAWLGHGIRFAIPGVLTTVFLNLFMFAVGLKVGPQFFAALRKDGWKGIAIALVVVGLNFAIVMAGARLLAMPPGFAPGLVSGSMTDTAVLGVATGAIENGTYQPPAGLPAADVAGNVAAAYAVTFLFSLVGMILLVRYLPRVLGVDTKAAAREAEAQYSGGANLPVPGVDAAYAFERVTVDVRAYRVEHPEAVGITVGELSMRAEAPVLRVLRGVEELDVASNPVLAAGDLVTVVTSVTRLATVAPRLIGPEVADERARDVGAEVADLVVTRREFVGITMQEATAKVRSRMAAGTDAPARLFHPVALLRDGGPVAIWPGLVLERGDILRVVGQKAMTKEVGKMVGASVRFTTESDILTLALGMSLGYLAGSFGTTVGRVPLHLGAPAGVMLAGIGISALRSRMPAFGGPVSEGARSLLQVLGLDVFIAVLALNTAPSIATAWTGGYVAPLLSIGIPAALLPPLVAWFVGSRVLGMNAALLAGAICGARHSTPALRVAQEEAASAVPAAGYAVAYAVSSVLVLMLGYVALFL